ncbi:hypothetical protein VH569_33780 [Azospirillum sp. 11R-A]|uniref:hypothetical protein n=1 Tax=Azospirillum sp. 11R-A TaxID=3111634 RepID=UPI003C2A8BCA
MRKTKIAIALALALHTLPATAQDWLCIGVVKTGNNADPLISSRAPLLLTITGKMATISFGPTQVQYPTGTPSSDGRILNGSNAPSFLFNPNDRSIMLRLRDGLPADQRWFEGQCKPT